MAVTDSTGAVVRTNRYDAYGGRTTSGTGVQTAFGFTGREQGSAGLNYHRDRYMDPATGRWLQPDKLGFQDGVSFYGYAHAEPVRHRDPYGLSVVTDDPEFRRALDSDIGMTPFGIMLLNVLHNQPIRFRIEYGALPRSVGALGGIDAELGYTGARPDKALAPYEAVNGCGVAQIIIRVDKANAASVRSSASGYVARLASIHAVVFHELMHAMQLALMTGASMFFVGSRPPQRIPLTWNLLGKERLDLYLFGAMGGDLLGSVIDDTVRYLDQHEQVFGQ